MDGKSVVLSTSCVGTYVAGVREEIVCRGPGLPVHTDPTGQ